ncbi:MAG: hypothetical protein KA586_06365 [Candidatus Promineofilum sp.]|nr:hypothetical protein [Promineifilum sp.]
MNIVGSLSVNQSKAAVTTSTLFRLAGLSAVVAGLCFIIIGLFHQVNVPASVTTATWANVHIAATVMGYFGILGLTGLYARQVGKAGWLGLAGFVMFSLWLAAVMAFSLVEAFILPGLAAESPAFVAGFLGMFTKVPSAVDLSALPMIWQVSGLLYIAGPLLFGIATFRAAVLSRWAGLLLALAAVLTPAAALLPAEYEPLIMVPVGLAMTWLGVSLFTERRRNASQG